MYNVLLVPFVPFLEQEYSKEKYELFAVVRIGSTPTANVVRCSTCTVKDTVPKMRNCKEDSIYVSQK
jgi:hypothetical protein